MSTSAQNPILDCYAAVEAASQAMLRAAHRNDWEELVECERSCALIIERLKAVEGTSAALDAETSRRRHEIILRVLADDAEIRNLTQPWLRQLEGHLGAVRQARSLASAYGG